MADTLSASAGSAVVPVTLPAEGRFAPVAGQPTPLLTSVRLVCIFSQLARRSTAMPRSLASARCRIVLAAR